MTLSPSASGDVLSEAAALSPLRRSLPTRHSELTLARSEGSRSASPIMRIEVPPTSPLTVHRAVPARSSMVKRPPLSHRLPDSPLRAGTNGALREKPEAGYPHSGAAHTDTQTSLSMSKAPLPHVISSSALALPPSAAARAQHPSRGVSPRADRPQPIQVGVSGPHGPRDGTTPAATGSAADEVSLLRANNAVLERNVETLKSLAQKLSLELKAAQKPTRQQRSSAAQCSADSAERVRADTGREEEEVRFAKLQREHQDQISRLHAVLAEKDAIIGQLSRDLEEQQACRISDMRRIVDDKNAVIASLVEQISHLRKA